MKYFICSLLFKPIRKNSLWEEQIVFIAADSEKDAMVRCQEMGERIMKFTDGIGLKFEKVGEIEEVFSDKTKHMKILFSRHLTKSTVEIMEKRKKLEEESKICFVCSLFFKPVCHNQLKKDDFVWRERLLFVTAYTEEEAKDYCLKTGEMAKMEDHDGISWKFEKVDEVCEIFDDKIGHGTGLFSRFLSESTVKAMEKEL